MEPLPVSDDWQARSLEHLAALWSAFTQVWPNMPSVRDGRLFPLLDVIEPLTRTIAGLPIGVCATEDDGGVRRFVLFLPERIALTHDDGVNGAILIVRAALAAMTAARLCSHLARCDDVVAEAREAARELEHVSPILGEAVHDAWQLAAGANRLGLITGAFVER